MTPHSVLPALTLTVMAVVTGSSGSPARGWSLCLMLAV
jgi:hypothetical protein